MALSAGDCFTCAACGHASVAKSKTAMDGWTISGTDLVCAFCGARLVDSSDADEASVSSPEDAATAACRRAALSFFGGDDECDARTTEDFLDVGGEQRFCRDCRYFVKHPFLSRCQLHQRAVEPMNDCADFERSSKCEPSEDAD